MARDILRVTLAAVLWLESDSVAQPKTNQAPAITDSSGLQDNTAPLTLDQVLHLPSVEVAALAEKPLFDQKSVRSRLEALKGESKAREESYKQAAKAADKQVEAKERELEKLPASRQDAEVNKRRKAIQCEIAAVKKATTDRTFIFLQEEIASDVQMAKLQLLANWPVLHQKISQEIATGTVAQRPFGNVLDIGNRSTRPPFADQEKDVAWGKKEMDQARQQGVFPKEISDPVLTEYVNRLAANLSRNSDLEVPLKVFLVQQDVRKDGRLVLGKDGQPEQVSNAMALPGGYLIVFAGVMQASANESEFAGVVAHEMAHCAARHGHRLAQKGTKFRVDPNGGHDWSPGFYSRSLLCRLIFGLSTQRIAVAGDLFRTRLGVHA